MLDSSTNIFVLFEEPEAPGSLPEVYPEANGATLVNGLAVGMFGYCFSFPEAHRKHTGSTPEATTPDVGNGPERHPSSPFPIVFFVSSQS